MLTKWFRPAGVELTRITPWSLEECVPKHILKAANKVAFPWDRDSYIRENWADQKSEEIWNGIGDAEEAFCHANNELIANVGQDPYCYEVSSAPLYNWKSLKKFFTVTDAFLDQFGLLRFSNEVCGTGGHIHVSINDDKEATMIQRLMLNHPEVMFAFCHPCDDHHELKNIAKRKFKTDGQYTIYRHEYAEDSKSGPIAYRGCYGTVEFRLFDVAQTWEMQEEHMAFAQAFVRHALKTPQKTLLFKEDVQARTVKEHVNNFRQLVKTLELPWERYKEYTDSIKYRFKWKTSNF